MYCPKHLRSCPSVYPPVVGPHAAVDHAYVFGDGLHFVDTLLVVQNGLLFLLRCQDNAIGS